MKGGTILVLLFIVSVLGCSFTMFQDEILEHPFLYSQDISISVHQYIYYLCEHLQFIILYTIILFRVRRYRKEVSVFLIFSALSLVDYLLRYNTTFFYIEDLKINLDLVTICVQSVVVFYAVSKQYVRKNLKL